MSTLYSAYEVPVSTIQSDTGGAYVIPANRYAVVRAEAAPASPFLINTEVVLTSASTVGGQVNTLTATTTPTTIFTATAYSEVQIYCKNPAGGTTTVQWRPLADASFAIEILSVAASTNGSVTIKMAPGDTLVATAGTGTNTLFTITSLYRQSDGGNQGTFRLKAGDAISGGKYHVELYRLPGSVE
jgi:hypothetical protein